MDHKGNQDIDWEYPKYIKIIYGGSMVRKEP